MNDSKKFKEGWPNRETFYNYLTGRKLATKSMTLFLRFGTNST